VRDTELVFFVTEGRQLSFKRLFLRFKSIWNGEETKIADVSTSYGARQKPWYCCNCLLALVMYYIVVGTRRD